MLFNSIEFIYLFFPIAFGLFLVIRTLRRTPLVFFLILVSLVFYGWHEPQLVGLLLGSVLFNYLGAHLLGSEREFAIGRRNVLIAWIAGNLCVLGFFKYTNFLIGNVNGILGSAIPHQDIVLPLAISFFTFQQIAFVVDSYKARSCDTPFLEYCLFVTFFPQLVAGPIVRHEEFAPQFRKGAFEGASGRDVAVGMAFVALGLFKKTVLADGVAPVVNAVFLADSAAVGSFEAWIGALGFAFQIYFDFSGYSDIAIGLAKCFGIVLPINFNAPYKATSIIDFWRRWHITLSRFLAHYLYIPLGGNRHGWARQMINLMIVMLLGGLWHGASWSFVIWGGLHGSYLVINHLWRRFRGASGDAARPLVVWSGRLLTFLAVLVAWVFFRAESLESALALLDRMASVTQWPTELTLLISAPSEAMPIIANVAPTFGAGGILALLLILLALVWFVPTSQECLGRYAEMATATDRTGTANNVGVLSHIGRPAAYAVLFGIALAAGILAVPHASEFIYFRF